MNRRFFVQEDLDRLTNFLTKSGMYYLSYDFKMSGLDLVIYNKYDSTQKNIIGEADKLNLTDKSISYKFAFSVSKRRKNDFFNLLNELVLEGVRFGDYGHEYTKLKNYDITKLFSYYTETEHKVLNTEFVRIEYTLDNIINALVIITLVDDTIRLFENMWGYEEDGTEVSVMKYQIGDIVSVRGGTTIYLTQDDTSKDWMIVGYSPNRPYVADRASNPSKSTEYKMDYKLVAIESNKGGIIRYGKVIVADESSIRPNRNNNLNVLLN